MAGSTSFGLGLRLRKIWAQQIDFNEKIRASKGGDTEEWAKNYILGIVSELDEILREINWKAHREGQKAIQPINLAWELADLTKYLLSLWELFGYSPADMLGFVWEKGCMVEELYNQEHTPAPVGKKVLITDLDGTLANWRSSFIEFLLHKGYISWSIDPTSTLMLDADLMLMYPEYHQWKEEFETTYRGYSKLIPYPDGIQTVGAMGDNDIYIVVYTARPVISYRHIWWDTYQWLDNWGIRPKKLFIGAEPRILLGHQWAKDNQIIVFDDDPTLILRAANSGLKVFARRHPYNEGVTHPNIRFVDNYSKLDWKDYWKEGSND